MKTKIHQRSIEATRKGFLWDTELVGFGLKVTDKGKKVFILQKRVDGRWKRWTLGTYPSLSPIEARTQAKTILGQITLGLVSSPVSGQLCVSFRGEIEKFYTDHVLAKLKPSTAKDMRYMIDKYLIPSFGGLSLEGVTPSMVRSFHSTLGSKHPYRANRVLALLAKFYAWQRTPVNPCKGVEKFREKRRELNQTYNLAGLSDPSVHPAIRLLLLTGMRKSEVLGLRWEYIQWDGPDSGRILFPDSKTGQKTVYLSCQALEVLRSVGPAEQGIVFPKPNLRRQWEKIRLPGLRLHDLRHHFATQACQHLSPTLVAGLLGHKDIKTTMRYVHNKDLGDAARLVDQQLSKFLKS